MYQVDSFFTKGVSHKICEDYTMHGEIDGNPFIIVCDGCSGSDDTDFGARLLARSAREAYQTLLRSNAFDKITNLHSRLYMLWDEIKLNLYAMIKVTHSKISVADATLLMTCMIDGKLYTFLRGDGTYVYRMKSTGNLVTTEVAFDSGAPYYFTYDLNRVNDELYHEHANTPMRIYTRTYDPDGELIDHETRSVPYNHPHIEVLNPDEIDFISIMSDGVSAFQYSGKYMGERKDGATSMENIVKEMSAYKNHNGEFVQRRMNMAMRRFEKQGLENFDDVSVATIWMGE